MNKIKNSLILKTLPLTALVIAGCSNDNEDIATPLSLNIEPLQQTAYLKASNTGSGDNFGAGGTLLGDAVALSKDGQTLAVGAPYESSNSPGVGGDQTDDSVYGAGAVYVFTLTNDIWIQESYIKASNPDLADNFGFITELNASGDTLAVSAHFEASSTTGINGNEIDDSIPQAGAVYVFVRTNDGWIQQAYIKASNTGEIGQGEAFGDGDQFGSALSLSDDGNTLAISSITEDGGSTGINGDQSDNSERSAGAVYLFSRDEEIWKQTAYIKPSNTGAGDLFGYSLSLAADGKRLAVGSFDEDGSNISTNQQQDDNLPGSGAVYIFDHDGLTWQQTAYLKTSNAERQDSLGVSVAISDDGNTLVATALDEDGMTTGINSNPVPDSDNDTSTGAIYVYIYENDNWSEQAYIKSSNTDSNDWFGSRLALSGDGNTLAAGAQLEDSFSRGINGNQQNNEATEAGAVYLFNRTSDTWTQVDYIKSSNSEAFDEFGSSISLSHDGSILAIGAQFEDSEAEGVNGNQANNSAFDSGAVYIFRR
ncbi:MAG: integrin [Rhodospirillaceae bacterium]|nr:integrin [Rhodospirillaceae bacterium]|tara:strand:- start:24195 stop:25805 length:1611 start_codon:yes stop_codon:yes gene_type:complete